MMKKKIRKTTKYDNSPLEKAFALAWKHTDIPILPQHKFHPKRKWAFDFAFPEVFLAIEIQGYGRGHASYLGMKSDYEKHNAAIEFGWTIIYLMKHDLEPKNMKETIDRITAEHERRSGNIELLGALVKFNRESSKKVVPTRKVSFVDLWLNQLKKKHNGQ
jgi:hypothetical protein